MPLTNQQLQELRSELEEAMARVRDRLESTDSFNTEDSMRDQTGELSVNDNHPGDLGSEMFERGKDLAIRDLYSLHLTDLDDALERMEDGTYGTCQHCGTEIPFERLQVQPSAKFCVECKDAQEEHEYESNRPVEENFLFPGYGRSSQDGNDEDYNGYDGEDAWQEVERYGPAQTNEPYLYYDETNEPHGYVQDIEGFMIADLHGNPMEPGFTRNKAYQRAFHEAGIEAGEEDLWRDTQ